MAKRQRQKRITNKKVLAEPLSVLFVSMNFFNDTGKEVKIIRTINSYIGNPESVQPLEQVAVFVRPGGFIKLWDYGKYFHLLVE